MKRALVKAGYKVECCTRIEKALAKVNSEYFDVIFVDYNLDFGKNAVDFVKRIDPKYTPKKCILVSGEMFFDKSIDLYFDSKIQKPVSVHAILKLLES
jgi:DNA-binding NtrC family response regulator